MSDAPKSFEVPVESLRAFCDPAQLPFETTASVSPVGGTVGQERALEALDFGLRVQTEGYNIFVTGTPGSGRSTTVLPALHDLAQTRPPADDWCYVNNFEDSYRPRALRLPPGRAPGFASAVDGLLQRCRLEIPKVFEDESYQQRRQQIGTELDRRRERVFEELQKEAGEHGLMVQFGSSGIVVLPAVNGRPMTPEEVQAMPDDARQQLRQHADEFQQHLHLVEALKEQRQVEQSAEEQVQVLDREAVLFAVGHLMDELRQAYKDLPAIQAHLEVLQAEVVSHPERFRPVPAPSEANPNPEPPIPAEDPLTRYRVNVLVTQDPAGGAPVVVDHNPTYYNLMGRIDYRPAFGGMTTDFRMIKRGSLQRANGGYLLLQAKDVLSNPPAWEALKRALDTGLAVIENLGADQAPTLTMRPEPIPLAVKVVLIGVPGLLDLLFQSDEDVRKLFKVKVDFDLEMDRTPQHIAVYAGFIRARVEDDHLLDFDRTGVAKIVEYGSRLLEHQEKLSTRFLDIADLVSESSYWASKDGQTTVDGAHVQHAVYQKEQRAGLHRDKLYRAIQEGVIDIASEGGQVGQVNGLSVLQTVDFEFGLPSRITARVSPGSGGVLNVEREIAMSGPIHSKGVLILAGYLAGKYAQDAPLSLNASITFEQLYNEVDGDSASSAELYCLLSALSGLPLSQSVAVTGSVNQQGHVQAIGGAQYKIEGFFDVCRARVLTGQQGVMIPAANVRHLMLREDVVEAAREGRFHVYAVSNVDEGIELLTGVPAGDLQPDGSYPEGTVNALVQAKLRAYAQHVRDYSSRAP